MRKLKNIELNRKTVNEYKNSKKTNLIIILDDIRSLNNIGSVFRTCDAFLSRKNLFMRNNCMSSSQRHSKNSTWINRKC